MLHRGSDDIHHVDGLDQVLESAEAMDTRRRHLTRRRRIGIVKADQLVLTDLLDAFDVDLAEMARTQDSYSKHVKIFGKYSDLFRSETEKTRIFASAMVIEDNYRHKGMRNQLVEQLRSEGFHDERVLAAINEVPRHVFLDSSFVEIAYSDQAFPIGSGQTISQPSTVACQTELLKIERGMKVLEIGTGSGYQACVLAAMGARVFTIERQRNLYFKTKEILEALPFRVKTYLGDGFEGLPTYAPFDRILVTAGAPDIAEALVGQLKTDGIMVVPVDKATGEGQTMLRLTKTADGTLTREEFGEFKFVPMLRGIGNN